MKSMPIKLLLTLATLSSGTTYQVFAQASDGHVQTRPWGYERGQEYKPYEAQSRGQSGNRIIINGRVIDYGDSGSPSTHQSTAFNRPAASTLPRNGTLGHGGTFNSVAMGNSVNLRGISNSTIVVNQINNGMQVTGSPGP